MEVLATYRSRGYTDYRANIASERLHVIRNPPIRSGTGPNAGRDPLGRKTGQLADDLEIIAAGQ